MTNQILEIYLSNVNCPNHFALNILITTQAVNEIKMACSNIP
jgi:hypothetical protein